jgi:hypothetical protein
MTNDLTKWLSGSKPWSWSASDIIGVAKRAAFYGAGAGAAYFLTWFLPGLDSSGLGMLLAVAGGAALDALHKFLSDTR